MLDAARASLHLTIHQTPIHFLFSPPVSHILSFTERILFFGALHSLTKLAKVGSGRAIQTCFIVDMETVYVTVYLLSKVDQYLSN